VEQARGGGRGAARLGDQPDLKREPFDGLAHFAFGDRDDAAHVLLDMGERQLTELLDTQRVRDRTLRLFGGPGDALAAVQRIPGVGGEFRLDADDRGVRAPGADRRRDAGDQPAAADRHDDEVHVRAVLGYLQPDCALAGDHLPVVERRDDEVPVLGGQLGGGSEPRAQ